MLELGRGGACQTSGPNVFETVTLPLSNPLCPLTCAVALLSTDVTLPVKTHVVTQSCSESQQHNKTAGSPCGRLAVPAPSTPISNYFDCVRAWVFSRLIVTSEGDQTRTVDHGVRSVGN